MSSSARSGCLYGCLPALRAYSPWRARVLTGLRQKHRNQTDRFSKNEAEERSPPDYPATIGATFAQRSFPRHASPRTTRTAQSLSMTETPLCGHVQCASLPKPPPAAASRGSETQSRRQSSIWFWGSRVRNHVTLYPRQMESLPTPTCPICTESSV